MDQDPSSMHRLDAGPALVKGIWAGIGVATIIVILRAIAKIRIRHFRLDDIVMIAALVDTWSFEPSCNWLTLLDFVNYLDSLPHNLHSSWIRG
jgi:hypothetical protein